MDLFFQKALSYESNTQGKKEVQMTSEVFVSAMARVKILIKRRVWNTVHDLLQTQMCSAYSISNMSSCKKDSFTHEMKKDFSVTVILEMVHTIAYCGRAEYSHCGLSVNCGNFLMYLGHIQLFKFWILVAKPLSEKMYAKNQYLSPSMQYRGCVNV